ncbi:MAG: type IV toxin-antitoxin system AbiEi family antitoxin domain-containing protein [Vulcanimicrobiaceae bacterium]
MPRYLDRVDDLIPLAEGRDGCFTAAEAATVGIPTALLAQLERTGHVERELPAVYRLARWSAAAHPGLWPALLWAESKAPAAFSHRTALALHQLSDVNPAKIELTFLDRMPRIRGAVPKMLSLRARKMRAEDVMQIDGLPVTRLKRTLVDLIVDDVALDAVDDVLENHRNLLKEDDLKAITALRELPRDLRNHIVHAGKANA